MRLIGDPAEYSAKHRYDAHFGALGKTLFLDGDHLSSGGKGWLVAQCSSDYQSGERLTKMSAGRLIGGAVLLLGPLAALLAAMAKKDHSKVYLGIQTPDGPIVVDAPASSQGAAMRFSGNVNAAAAAARARLKLPFVPGK